jgi:hypothetical protein
MVLKGYKEVTRFRIDPSPRNLAILKQGLHFRGHINFVA